MRSVTLNFADWLEAIFWHSFWHIFWHSFWHIFWNSFWHIFWQIFWHSFWHIFSHSFWHISRLRSGAEHSTHRIAVEVRRGTLDAQDRGWGPARNTRLTASRLRSGAEHLTHGIAVEVRSGTLDSQDRGWGPARNTRRTGSRLRSGAEHSTHRIAVEVRRGGGPGGRRQADIKSNNPHLTGGEQKTYFVSLCDFPFVVTRGSSILGGSSHLESS